MSQRRRLDINTYQEVKCISKELSDLSTRLNQLTLNTNTRPRTARARSYRRTPSPDSLVKEPCHKTQPRFQRNERFQESNIQDETYHQHRHTPSVH
mmetsp:Transcript_534/g.872  ORF Transcript_534/g.872 Transcript_534/m.872 type:complete len:96 (-) Transcript_534:1343-1630(-)